MNGRIAHKTLINFMKEISKQSGIKDFFLFGGNVIDFYLSNKLNYEDIDILIRGIDNRLMKHVIAKLKIKGFLVSPKRRYYICNTTKVYLYQANNKKFFLDITFADNPKKIIGPFNALSMYCKYPECLCIDNNGCLKALKNKEFHPLKNRGFNNENPYILISRFLLLCAKYNASLIKPESHFRLLNEFNKRKQTWKNITQFHLEGYLSFLSKTLQSILKSKYRAKFMKELLESKILEKTFDELQIGLSKVLGDPRLLKEIELIKTNEELLRIVAENLEKKNKLMFFKKIKGLSSRKWDKNDKMIRLSNIK